MKGGGTGNNMVVRNCIVYYNVALLLGDNYNPEESPSYESSCTTPHLGGTGNIVTKPGLLSFGNPHILPGSPCIDAGDSSDVVAPTDIDGEPRIAGGQVDIGCDEF